MTAEARFSGRAAGARGLPGFALIVALTVAVGIVLLLVWSGWVVPARSIDGQADALFPGFTAESSACPAGGLVVTSLRSDSEAAGDGIEVGDCIVAIDGRRIETLDQARRYLHNDAMPALSLDLVHDQHRRQLKLARNAGGAHGS
ncbi:PDZ domain-containing protein [Sphingomonas sp. HF-S3]|uniref:PDZ domain-containing protein n=1 Tax=Sphingomonas rustica TaxID=3103142 RepID=A0ABV0BAW6_9SPHN